MARFPSAVGRAAGRRRTPLLAAARRCRHRQSCRLYGFITEWRGGASRAAPDAARPAAARSNVTRRERRYRRQRRSRVLSVRDRSRRERIPLLYPRTGLSGLSGAKYGTIGTFLPVFGTQRPRRVYLIENAEVIQT